MSRGPENTFIASVHKHLPQSLYRMKNNNVFNGGIADVWYSGPTTDLWVEYKFIVLPKRSDTLVDLCGGKNPALSHLQQEWLRSRSKEGRNIAVMVGCKEGGVWFGDNSWALPLSVLDFTRVLYSRKEMAQLIERYTGIS